MYLYNNNIIEDINSIFKNYLYFLKNNLEIDINSNNPYKILGVKSYSDISILKKQFLRYKEKYSKYKSTSNNIIIKYSKVLNAYNYIKNRKNFFTFKNLIQNVKMNSNNYIILTINSYLNVEINKNLIIGITGYILLGYILIRLQCLLFLLIIYLFKLITCLDLSFIFFCSTIEYYINDYIDIIDQKLNSDSFEEYYYTKWIIKFLICLFLYYFVIPIISGIFLGMYEGVYESIYSGDKKQEKQEKQETIK